MSDPQMRRRSGRTPWTPRGVYALRQWLARADRESEPCAGRIMSEAMREILRSVLDDYEAALAAAAVRVGDPPPPGGTNG